MSSDARQYLIDHDRSNVVKHLSHIMRTSEIYYEQMNSKDATDAHTTIQSLSIKRKWSKTEITQLKDRWPLSGTPPVFKEWMVRTYVCMHLHNRINRPSCASHGCK